MRFPFFLSLAILVLTYCLAISRTDNSGGLRNSSVLGRDTTGLIDDYLTKLAIEKNFCGGLLIIKNGKTILSKGYGWADKEKQIPFTPTTLASMGSITKAFTAAAIMKLAEQHKLSLDDNLKKIFPSVPADKAAITIHQLLTHSSGFHEFLAHDGGDFEKLTTAEFLKRTFSEPLAFKPGEKAVYTNVGMSILGIIIEKISGLKYEAFLKKYLFDPIGIKHIGYHYPTFPDDSIAIGYQNGVAWGTHQQHFEKAGGGPFWNLKANGGLEASLDEMAMWANGISNYSILKESSIRKMFTPYLPEDGNIQTSFGYGCTISKSRRNTFLIDNGGSNGIYFARLIRLPEEGMIFYMVTTESSINSNMVMPNVSQLYFQGKIVQDATTMQPKFENKLTKQVYDIADKSTTTDLATELAKENVKIDDDMVLLEAGERLIAEQKFDRALILYSYYTKQYPNIVVAWNDLGDIYVAQNKKEEAIKCYKQALKIRPANPRAKEALEKLGK